MFGSAARWSNIHGPLLDHVTEVDCRGTQHGVSKRAEISERVDVFEQVE